MMTMLRNDPSWTPEEEDSNDEEQPDVQSNTVSDEENFHCEKCDVYFTSTQAFRQHKRDNYHQKPGVRLLGFKSVPQSTLQILSRNLIPLSLIHI